MVVIFNGLIQLDVSVIISMNKCRRCKKDIKSNTIHVENRKLAMDETWFIPPLYPCLEVTQ